MIDPSGFVLLSDCVPQVVQEIRQHSTCSFIGACAVKFLFLPGIFGDKEFQVC